jgi:hypothetical protein
MSREDAEMIALVAIYVVLYLWIGPLTQLSF